MKSGSVVAAESVTDSDETRPSLAARPGVQTTPAAENIACEIAASGELLLRAGPRVWRVRGWQKNTLLEVMKVNVQVLDESTGAFHVDSFDMYHAKQRQAYIGTAAAELECEAAVIKREAGRVLLALEQQQDEQRRAAEQELVKGLLSGQDYIKRNPDSEAMAKAQSIMNTWGYHKSNASIGDAPLLFGGSVLGITIKGMAVNMAIGVGVNTGVQLDGKHPLSYVEAIMAGIIAAATTGKGIVASAPINMGGAAVNRPVLVPSTF